MFKKIDENVGIKQWETKHNHISKQHLLKKVVYK